MVLSFKYRKEIFENRKKYFPKIPIILFNEGKRIETVALLDSGATDIFIPKGIAEALELKLENLNEADSWTGKFKVWESKIGLIVGKGSQTFRKIISCTVPDQEWENEEVVFGRSFFHFFEIIFNEAELTTKLKRITQIKKGKIEK
ncbi:MAG: hypothetical protein ABIA76_03785 [Candidatus Diapherotrites archaeon]